MNFDDFNAVIAVIDWPELNKINTGASECLKYLGNHFGDDFNVYAVFSGEGVLKAVKID